MQNGCALEKLPVWKEQKSEKCSFRSNPVAKAAMRYWHRLQVGITPSKMSASKSSINTLPPCNASRAESSDSVEMRWNMDQTLFRNRLKTFKEEFHDEKWWKSSKTAKLATFKHHLQTFLFIRCSCRCWRWCPAEILKGHGGSVPRGHGLPFWKAPDGRFAAMAQRRATKETL